MLTMLLRQPAAGAYLRVHFQPLPALRLAVRNKCAGLMKIRRQKLVFQSRSHLHLAREIVVVARMLEFHAALHLAPLLAQKALLVRGPITCLPCHVGVFERMAIVPLLLLVVFPEKEGATMSVAG